MEITLEKVDKIRERLNVSYEMAKLALEKNDGDVLEALIYLEKENNIKENSFDDNFSEDSCTSKCDTVEEFKIWIKSLIEKGNLSRIRIKKDEEVLVDVPVNAGVSAMVIAVVLPPVLAFGVIAAVATKITIEITKTDGSVEVINKYVKDAALDAKDRANKIVNNLKDKAFKTASDVKDKVQDIKGSGEKVYSDDDTIYTYTVKFDE